MGEAIQKVLKRKVYRLIKRKVSKAKMKKERSPMKVKKVLEKKDYKGGKTPRGKELHHLEKNS